MSIKFVAEIGLNHNGNFDLCQEMIKQAKFAGADVVKFQLGWRSQENEINHIDDKKLRQLYKWCNFYEIDILFSVFEYEYLEMLVKYKPKAIKIASRTLKEKFDLVKKIVKLNIETYISLGMVDSNYFPFDNANVKYLWCKSTYPNDNQDINLIPENFVKSKYYGFSDHFIGIEAALIAITRGARLIEKHFTLDKANQTIRDHTLSATPSEFKFLVDHGRIIHNMLYSNVQ
tara:strand:- start:158 stop:850 length:693 start_codon:yes stop_codon:yes gene_type:complete